jgi:hypothetical protein
MESPIDELINKVKENPNIFEAESIDAFTVLNGLYSKLKYRSHLFKNDLIWIFSFFEYINNYSKNEKTRYLLQHTIELVKLIK